LLCVWWANLMFGYWPCDRTLFSFLLMFNSASAFAFLSSFKCTCWIFFSIIYSFSWFYLSILPVSSSFASRKPDTFMSSLFFRFKWSKKTFFSPYCSRAQPFSTLTYFLAARFTILFLTYSLIWYTELNSLPEGFSDSNFYSTVMGFSTIILSSYSPSFMPVISLLLLKFAISSSSALSMASWFYSASLIISNRFLFYSFFEFCISKLSMSKSSWANLIGSYFKTFSSSMFSLVLVAHLLAVYISS